MKTTAGLGMLFTRQGSQVRTLATDGLEILSIKSIPELLSTYLKSESLTLSCGLASTHAKTAHKSNPSGVKSLQHMGGDDGVGQHAQADREVRRHRRRMNCAGDRTGDDDFTLGYDRSLQR